MKIVLLENLRKLGNIGEIISVKRGYARNFLIPQNKALFASAKNIKEVEKIKTDLQKGTGFFLKNEDGLQLNTQIGFKENRAIFWDSRAYHSPLNFSAEDKTKRFSIIAQYKEIE